MKFASIIVGIYFVIMIIKGSIDNTFYTLVVLAFVLYGILKKKKTKRKYKKISSKKNNTTKLKNNKVNQTFNSYKIDPKKFNQNKYTNEPVNQTEQFSIEKKKISRLRQMKALSASNVTDTNKLFYLQGTFMDDYVDNYDINVPCNKNNPVYNNLTIYQLRSYFSWRTLIRNKLYKQTEQSYVFLYIYELLNKIGVKNEIDGLNKIIDLWQNYRVFDNSFDKYLSKWVKDYYIINRINIDFNLIEEEFPIKNNDNLEDISEILIGNYENKLEFLDSISNYHILKSKIMEHKYSFLINLVIPEIFKNLDKYFSENNLSFVNITFGEFKKKYWNVYENAIYFNNKLESDFVFKFKNLETYYRKGNNYYKETFELSQYSKCIVGYILKNIEITLRECLKFSKNLKLNISSLDELSSNAELYSIVTDKKFNMIINNTIKKYLIEHKTEINNIITKEKKEEIVIDANKFNEIRKSSSRIQEKLIVEEENYLEKEEQVEIEIINSSQDIFKNLVDNLNNIELDFLKKIVNNEPRNNLIDYSKQNNILFEIMIENINKVALETIGDNLIEDNSDEIIIYAEYIDSLKEKL